MSRFQLFVFDACLTLGWIFLALWGWLEVTQ